MGLFHAVIPTGIKHGTVTVLFKGHSYEVTTFRIEREYQDHRHPDEVVFVRSLEEDLKRRDFTMNALAVHADSGVLVDLHGGREDLQNRLIRAIGDPESRFSEDALRILRACRFAAQLDFSIEERTMDAMKKLSGNLVHISGERVKSELFKILESPIPSRGLLAMHACGALEVLLPELAAGENVTQKSAHAYDIMYHGIAACDAVTRNKPLVRLAALLHDIGKVQAKRITSDGEITFYRHEEHSAKMAKRIMNRLRCSNDERSTVVNLIRNHMFHYTPDWSDGAVRRFVKRVGADSLDDLFTLRLADQDAIHGKPRPEDIIELEKRIYRVLDSSSALSIHDLAVNGNDLALIGIPKGPVMGIVLKQLLETVLDDPSENEYEKLIEIARNYYEQRIKGPQDHRSPTS
ncbi:MAG TPA: HD domain-containing protein, partial [Sphaerochaetaceae bacterium]|jgi:poly(A) polymerase/tRNA nucleotidyltransferase (CCA-adding enzyme)|nr:HD domain-containing protein [Sphaerochaetaceae bacterium]